MAQHRARGGLGGEQARCREQLPQHDRGRVDIGAAIDRLAERLLGRHVPRLALDLAGDGPLQPIGGVCDAEIEHARDAIARDEDVVRRYVAVHDVQRGAGLVARLVGGVQTFEDAAHDGDRDRDRHDGAPRGEIARGRGQRGTVHVLHHEQQLVAVDDVEHRDDVRVADAHDQPRLVAQHRALLGVVGILQPLDRDEPREATVADERAEVHRRHSARGQRVEQPVTSDATLHAPWSITVMLGG